MNDRDEEFGAFIRNRATPLHQTAYLLCGDWHLAHDLVQDTLVKAYQHWPRVRRADSPDAYVRAILLNEARSRWRRRERTVPARASPRARAGTPDATDEITRREGLLQALLRPAAAAARDGHPPLPGGDERARDRRRPRLQRRHGEEPERPGARHPEDLSRPNGVKL